MIPRFLRRRRSGTVRPPAVPPGTRVYAVGDVHGQLEPLTRLVGMIRDDAARVSVERRVAIFVGDYVDRGHESRQVIDFLYDVPLPGFETIHLKGNHDAWLLAFLRDAAVGTEWLHMGGQATLLSYGVAAPLGARSAEALEAVREAFARALPPEHRTFLERLRLSHVEGDYAFVHAGIRPGVALEDQQEEDLLWIRDAFTGDRSDHGKVVVHGHSVTDRPDIRHNRIGIDTGAYATGRLTSIVLEGESRRFLTSCGHGR